MPLLCRTVLKGGASRLEFSFPELPVTDLPDRLAVTPQYLLPKRALTVFAGWVANLRGGPLTQYLIRDFIARYAVNMAEAADPRPESYATFNEFFTRALRADARPIDAAALVCPVDAAISQF